MKVSELIEELSKLNPESEVVCEPAEGESIPTMAITKVSTTQKDFPELVRFVGDRAILYIKH